MGHESNGQVPKSKRILPRVPATPIATIRDGKDPLLEAYDELNSMWKAAEVELQNYRVPTDVCIELPGGSFLGDPQDPEGIENGLFGFVKYNEQWRICVGVYRDMYHEHSYWQWKPIAESPIEKRVEMAPRFEELRVKVLEARDNFFPRVSGAIEALKRSLEK